jgi:hypothetical protein
MVRFVTIKKFCELTGFSESAVYTRKCKGIWPEGSVWKYEPGTKKILMNLEAYDAWVENGETPLAIGGRSPTLPSLTPPTPKSRARRTGSRSRLRPTFDR